MLLSILVYSLLAIVLYLLAKMQVEHYWNARGNLYEGKSPFWTLPVISSILFFAVICGVRYNVGVDNVMYIDFYNALSGSGDTRDDFEIGYKVMSQIFSDMGMHFSVFMGFWAALQIGFVYFSQRKSQYLLPFIALFIVLGPTFLNWTNGLRQCVATCAFFCIVEYAIERKLLKYVVGILMCSLIHKSAIILLPCYFLFQKPVFPRNKFVLVGILLVCTFIGNNPTWVKIFNNLQELLIFLDYDNYASGMENLTEKGLDSMAWGPGRLGIWLLHLMAVIYYPEFLRRYHLTKRFEIYFFCFFIGACLFNLLANTSHIFLRPISYFRDFQIMVIPVCLYFFNKERRHIPFTIILVLAFFYTLYCTIKAFSVGLGERSFEVYKFFFLQ